MKKIYDYTRFPTIGYAINWLNQNPRYTMVTAYPEEGKIVLVYYYIKENKTSEDGNKKV